MGRACSTNGERRNAYRGLVGKPEERRPLGRIRSRWVNNIKMNLRDIGSDGMDWIDLARDRDKWMDLVNTVITFGFNKMLGSSCVAAQLAASQERLSSMSE
jgi:hypothetical protein